MMRRTLHVSCAIIALLAIDVGVTQRSRKALLTFFFYSHALENVESTIKVSRTLNTHYLQEEVQLSDRSNACSKEKIHRVPSAMPCPCVVLELLEQGVRASY
jgi:hypothetical protein